MSCYRREILSRYQDGSLDETRSAEIASHLDGCVECREVLRTLGRAGLFLRIAVGSHRSAECLADEELGAYLAGVMRAEDRRRVEEHLAGCRICLHEVAVLSDDAATTPVAESPRPDARALARFARLAPAASRRSFVARVPWRRIAAVAAALVVAVAVGGHYLSRPVPTLPVAAAMPPDWRPLRYVTEASFGGTDALVPTGSAELGRFAREAGIVLREIERLHEAPRPEALELVREDILNSGLVETVARLREFTHEDRDRRFLNDCEYVLMEVVKADARDLDSPDGGLTRIVSEMRRLKLTETARLIEMEGSRSQWLAGL